MDKIMIKAMAKVNLSFDIIGKRLNGYHNIMSIMQSINLYDKIILKILDSGINIKTDNPHISDNIVSKVSKKVLSDFNIKKGLDIFIRKSIPISAGLGGGSADAAAVLIALNKCFGIGMNQNEMIDYGVQFGADVPFCIVGGTALVEGIGEKIRSLPSLDEMVILVCTPQSFISTKSVYKKYDKDSSTNKFNTDILIDAVYRRDILKIAKNMFNVFESITAKENPEIMKIKQIMLENGAIGANMSGSGASVFGIYEKTKYAKLSLEKLQKFSRKIFITKTNR